MVAGRKKATDKSHKKNSETSGNVVSSGASSTKLSDFLNSSLRSKVLMIAIITVVAAIGAYLLFKSFATTPLSTSTNPNDVIVQYSLPHALMPRSVTNLQTPNYAPFTLYGNGLLICGHDTTDPFAPQTAMSMNMVADANTYQLPTSTTLTQDQIATLISQINATGFFQLNKEYFNAPLDAAQDILRVSTANGDHYVLYYNDVAAPTAYTATLNILQNYCQQATTPYQSNTVTVRSLQYSNPKNHAVTDASTLNSTVSTPINQAIAAAGVTHGRRGNSAPVSTTTVGEADTNVTGADAQAITAQFAKNAHQFIQRGGVTYEVGVDEQPPAINNPLNINYSQIRNTQVGFLDKLKNFFVPKTSAASLKPVRIVILQASDEGPVSQTLINAVNEKIGAVNSWYCGAVGECYNYAGASVIVGNLTEAGYMTCPNNGCPGNPMLGVIENAYNNSTLNNPNYDTEIITGWPTNEVNVGVCGYGYVGAPMAVTDLQEPVAGCGYGMDMAHELGHTFGLNHTGNGTLMDGPPQSQYAANCDIDDPSYPVCRLDSNQAFQLRYGTPQYFYTSTAALPGGDGYWTVASDGGIFTTGTQFYGSAGGIALAQPVTGMTATPDSGGYFLTAADGGIFAYGDAGYVGGANQYGHNGPIIAIAARGDNSYWQLDTAGEIFSFNAPYYGGGSQYAHNGNFVGMAVTNDGGGYWLVDSTGQIFAFGDAGYFGAPSGQTTIVGIAATHSGGYVEVNNGGGVFTYGTNFYGSIPGLGIGASDVVGIAGLNDGGYVVTRASGASYWFSSNGTNNTTVNSPLNKPLVGVAGLRSPSATAPVAPPGVNPQYEPISIPTNLKAVNGTTNTINLTWLGDGPNTTTAAETQTGQAYCWLVDTPSFQLTYDYLCSNTNYNLYYTYAISGSAAPSGYTCTNYWPLTNAGSKYTGYTAWICWPPSEDNILGNGTGWTSTNTGGNLFYSNTGNPNSNLYNCIDIIDHNWSAWSKSASLCQSIPANNFGPSTKSVNLTWSASTNATGYGISGYYIYRNGALLGTSNGPGTSYSDLAISPSTTYSYQIAAFGPVSSGNPVSNTTSPVSITTPTPPDLTPPSTPTNLSATATAYNNVNLTWTNSTDNVGVTGYFIVRNGTTIAQTSGSITTYSDKTVSPSSSYSYQVIATDAAGNHSASSNSASATTPAAPDTTPPSVPTNLSGSAVSTSQINLSWTASTDNIGVIGYNVYRNGSKIASVTSTSFGDSGLSSSTSYQYYVKAYDASGNLSAASTTITVQTQSPAPAPGGLSGLVTSSSGSKPIQGATVSFTVNGTTHTSITTSTGNYTFSSVPVGTYSLSCIAPGYRNQTTTVKISSSAITTQNFVLLNTNGKKQ